MSDEVRRFTITISGSPEGSISFPIRDAGPESPYRMLTEAEGPIFESICELLVSAISQLPAEEDKLRVLIPTELCPLSDAMITHIFNWLKFNHWKPLTYGDFTRHLSADRIH